MQDITSRLGIVSTAWNAVLTSDRCRMDEPAHAAHQMQPRRDGSRTKYGDGRCRTAAPTCELSLPADKGRDGNRGYAGALSSSAQGAIRKGTDGSSVGSESTPGSVEQSGGHETARRVQHRRPGHGREAAVTRGGVDHLAQLAGCDHPGNEGVHAVGHSEHVHAEAPALLGAAAR